MRQSHRSRKEETLTRLYCRLLRPMARRDTNSKPCPSRCPALLGIWRTAGILEIRSLPPLHLTNLETSLSGMYHVVSAWLRQLTSTTDLSPSRLPQTPPHTAHRCRSCHFLRLRLLSSAFPSPWKERPRLCRLNSLHLGQRSLRCRLRQRHCLRYARLERYIEAEAPYRESRCHPFRPLPQTYPLNSHEVGRVMFTLGNRAVRPTHVMS